MKTLEKSPKTAPASKSAPTIKKPVVEKFTVPEKWVKVESIIELSDCEYLESANVNQAKVGTGVWSILSHDLGEEFATRCKAHAVVGDPVSITFIMEEWKLREMQKWCKTAKVNLADAIRIAIFTRCQEIRKFRRRKDRAEAKVAVKGGTAA
jgi:hypothetical protein